MTGIEPLFPEEEGRLPFLLRGGRAVVLRGVARTTADGDRLVPAGAVATGSTSREDLATD